MAIRTPAKHRNPTQADIIHVMLVQAVNDAQDKVLTLKDPQDRREAVAARNALIAIKHKVQRYLGGDLNALLR